MLGLIPSSEEGWATACACLKPDNGGWLYVNGNVTSSPPHSTTGSRIPTASSGDTAVESSTIKHSSWYIWSNSVALKIMTILNDLHEEKQWSVIIRHIQHVKSYAPHVDHLVVDLECRPPPCTYTCTVLCFDKK